MTTQEQIQNAHEQIAQIEQEAQAEREALQKQSAWRVKETFRVLVRSKNIPYDRQEQIEMIIDRKYMIRIRLLNTWIEKLERETKIEAAKKRIEEINAQAMAERKVLRKQSIASLKAEGNQLCRVHSAQTKTEYIDLIIDCKYGCSIPALERKIAYLERQGR